MLLSKTSDNSVQVPSVRRRPSCNSFYARGEAYQGLYFAVLQNFPKILPLLIMIENKNPVWKNHVNIHKYQWKK